MAGLERKRHKSPVEWLRGVRAFASMPEAVLKRLYGESHMVTISRGETLITTGQPAEALYVVISGRLRVTSFSGGAHKTEIGPGSVLGETAFLGRLAYEDTATALRNSIVLKLEWDSFRALAEGVPDVWQATLESLARAPVSVKAAPRPRTDRARSICICPAGGDPLPKEFVAKISEALEARAECQFLSAEGLGQDLPGGIALDDPQVVHWMKEQEARFDVIVLLADPEPTPWTEKALTDADEICLVGLHDGARLGAPVALGGVEELAFELRGADACRLALYHEPRRGVTQAGARRWLEVRPVRSHHHLRPGYDKDYERLARFLLGQSTGFLASATGVYSAATLGIYKAVQASGFEFDCFAGTGTSAAIAACLALGMDADDIDQLMTEMMVTGRALKRRTWPVFGLYDQRRFDRLLLKHFPDTDIADLPMPFYAVSANLSSGESQVHAIGNMQIAVRANWPFPGLLPPFIDEEGRMLVDGSIVEPLPLERMHLIHAGPNVAARAAVAPFGKAPIPYRELPAQQRLARRRWLPWRSKEQGPSLPSYETMLAAVTTGNAARDDDALGGLDMLLAAPIPDHLDVMAWDQHSRLKDQCYQWALAELEKRAASNDLPLVAAIPNA
jgi:NTE family protein